MEKKWISAFSSVFGKLLVTFIQALFNDPGEFDRLFLVERGQLHHAGIRIAIDDLVSLCSITRRVCSMIALPTEVTAEPISRSKSRNRVYPKPRSRCS